MIHEDQKRMLCWHRNGEVFIWKIEEEEENKRKCDGCGGGFGLLEKKAYCGWCGGIYDNY